MRKYEYVGCFFDCNDFFNLMAPLRKNPLKNNKTKPHVTFKYNPVEVSTELFGTEINVTINGYGNNGENEGVSVTLTSNNEIINKMIAQIEVPHITLAVSDNGQAVNTRYLEFVDIEPLQIVGKYGGHQDI